MTILVVENSVSEMACAVGWAASLGINVVRAWSVADAFEYITTVDGIITDIYIPLNTGEVHNHSDRPCGLLVAFKAQKNQIPFIFCTSGYNHQTKYEWVTWLTQHLDWPQVIDGMKTESEEYASKNWGKAFDRLLRMIGN